MAPTQRCTCGYALDLGNVYFFMTNQSWGCWKHIILEKLRSAKLNKTPIYNIWFGFWEDLHHVAWWCYIAWRSQGSSLMPSPKRLEVRVKCKFWDPNFFGWLVACFLRLLLYVCSKIGLLASDEHLSKMFWTWEDFSFALYNTIIRSHWPANAIAQSKNFRGWGMPKACNCG